MQRTPHLGGIGKWADNRLVVEGLRDRQISAYGVRMIAWEEFGMIGRVSC